MYIFPETTAIKTITRIAVLTSGGDAPGMNAALRAVVRVGISRGIETLGVYRGYSGLVDNNIHPLDSSSVANIIQRGGTILKSDRCDDFRHREVRQQVADQLREKHIDALIVIGGDGSLTGAHLLEKETGFPVIGLPGTIDNDIFGTDDTIGFDSAVNTALESIDKIRDTANSHNRLFLVEVMGRNSGFIAAQTGIAGGAEMIIVPEFPVAIDEIYHHLEDVRSQQKSSILLLAEGEPGATYQLAGRLEQRGLKPRVCILGHTQRGGAPTGHDRLLASCLGAMAINYLQAGVSDIMVGVQGKEVVAVPLEKIKSQKKPMDTALIDLSGELLGYQ